MGIIKEKNHQKWNRVASFGSRTSWKRLDVLEKLCCKHPTKCLPRVDSKILGNCWGRSSWPMKVTKSHCTFAIFFTKSMGSKTQGRNLAQHGSRNSFAGVKKNASKWLTMDSRNEPLVWILKHPWRSISIFGRTKESFWSGHCILSGDINHFLQQVLK